MQDRPKNLIFRDQAIKALKSGLDQLADAVKETLGPRGRNVIIERGYGSPSVTKDGVSVAKEIDLADPFENLGAQMAKDVAAKTCDEAGDGTTTATVLAQAVTDEGVRVILNGGSPVELKRGMDRAVDDLEVVLRHMAKPADDLETVARVGTISANNEPKIGAVLAEAIDKVGQAGVVTIEEGSEPGIRLEFIEGMELPEGMVSPHFITAENSSEINISDAVFFLVNKNVATIQEILPGIESVLKVKERPPIVLVCHNISKPALDQILANVLKGAVNMTVIRIPGFGDQKNDNMYDMATALGGEVFGDASSGGLPLSEASVEKMGQAGRVRISSKTTTIFEPMGDPEQVHARVEALQASAKSTESEYDREKILNRVAKLSGAMAVVYVGGRSEVEAKELRDRVEDAMHATRAAVEEGIVPGGGTALILARKNLQAPVDMSPEQVRGYNIVLKAIEAPIRNILLNAGQSPDIIIEKINEGIEKGFNAHTGKYEDLLETGVIDPVKVTVTALRNAVSIAGMLLTASCAITYDRASTQATDLNHY